MTHDGSLIARSVRVRAIREWLRLARGHFEKKYGIKAATLQSWETPREKSGLTEKGAKKLVAAFNAEGVPCTLVWLLHGIGDDPLPDTFATHRFETTPLVSPTINITQELKLFYQSCSEGVDTIIADDALASCFLPGDHVAGKRYFGKEMTKALNTCCIVHTQAGGILVRTLHAGSQKDCYTLTCTNPATTVEKPTLTNIALFSAAPIIWFRRPQDDST